MASSIQSNGTRVIGLVKISFTDPPLLPLVIVILKDRIHLDSVDIQYYDPSFGMTTIEA